MKKGTLKSKLFAAALTLAAAFTMTAGQAIVMPDTAQAGVISSIKGAAKKVGGTIKSAAKSVAKSPIATPVKKVGSALQTVNKTITKGVNSAASRVIKAARR